MDYYKYIEDYKNGTLPADLREAFTTEMARNPSLQKAVDNYSEAKDISEGLLEVDIMATINRLEKESKIDKPESKVMDIKKWSFAAAMIGLLMMAGWWMISTNEKMTDDQLWAAYYEIPINDIERGSNDPDLTPIEQAKLAYHYKDYNKSMLLLKSLIASQAYPTEESQLNLYLGHALVAQERYEEAVTYFQRSIEPEAKYSLAVVYIRLDERAKARALLENDGSARAKMMLNSF